MRAVKNKASKKHLIKSIMIAHGSLSNVAHYLFKKCPSRSRANIVSEMDQLVCIIDMKGYIGGTLTTIKINSINNISRFQFLVIIKDVYWLSLPC